jgi:hypothetical protein
VSLGRESFASGMLCAASEACTSAQPVLFLSYDPPMTEPLLSLLPVAAATASAWVIASSAVKTDAAPLASFELGLHPGAMPAEPTLPGWLPAAWVANSSAQGLVALALIDDPEPQPAREFALGAQTLRLTRIATAAAC